MLNDPYSPLAFAYAGQASDSLASPAPLACDRLRRTLSKAFTRKVFMPSNYIQPFHVICNIFSSLLLIIFIVRSWGSSVSIVSTANWTTWRPSFDSWHRQMTFPLAPVSRPALGPTQPRIQWIPGVISPEVKHGWVVTLTTHPIQCRGRERIGIISLSPLSLARR
jgi:hypothetical protein